VLSGGTAVALSGTDTVQSDDLGPGAQVKAPDVAANAVNGSDVVDNSLTGADVSESTLAMVPSAAHGARRIAFDHPNTDAAPVNVLTLREMTLKARCYAVTPGDTTVKVYIASTILSDVNWSYARQDNQDVPFVFASGKTIGPSSTLPQQLVAEIATSSGFQRAVGQFIYRNANRVIALTLHAIANNTDGRCQVTGVAVPAPG
jgi:hypothetical protein